MSDGNPVVVAADGRVLGLVAMADTVKADAKAAVARLRSLGIEPVMLTEDNVRTVQAVARAVGIAMGAGTDIAIESADVVVMAKPVGRGGGRCPDWPRVVSKDLPEHCAGV